MEYTKFIPIYLFICKRYRILFQMTKNEENIHVLSSDNVHTCFIKQLANNKSVTNKFNRCVHVSPSRYVTFTSYKQHLIVCHSFTAEHRRPYCELTNNDLEDHQRATSKIEKTRLLGHVLPNLLSSLNETEINKRKRKKKKKKRRNILWKSRTSSCKHEVEGRREFPFSKMHGISHLLSHHGSHNGDARTVHHHHQDKTSSDSRTHDTKILQELLNQKHIQRRISRGSVSSTYSYGSSTSYGSSHGSNSSSSHSSSLHHGVHNHSVYHTIHGSSHHHQSIHHHHPLHHIHQLHPQHPQHQTSSGRASPTSPSPTSDHEKHHHQKDHHHYSIQEMIRHFGRRLGHIRRQSECQDPPRKKEEDFRNRSQSLDGGARYPNLRDADCETTYRIYESILRQGNRNDCWTLRCEIVCLKIRKIRLLKFVISWLWLRLMNLAKKWLTRVWSIVPKLGKKLILFVDEFCYYWQLLSVISCSPFLEFHNSEMSDSF